MVKHLPNDCREKIKEHFEEKLSHVWKSIPRQEFRTTHKIQDFSIYIEKLEKEVYDARYLLGGSVNKYRLHLHSLIVNLEENGGNLFLKYSPKQLASLNSMQLSENYKGSSESYIPIGLTYQQELQKPAPKGSLHEIYSNTIEELEKTVLPQIIGENVPSFIRCNKCHAAGKEGQVRSRERQTRSGDEPMSLYLNCKICGSQWRGD